MKVLVLLTLILVGCGKNDHKVVYVTKPSPNGTPIECLSHVGPRGAVCHCFMNGTVESIDCN